MALVGIVTLALWAFGRIQCETVWRGLGAEKKKTTVSVPPATYPLSVLEAPGSCLFLKSQVSAWLPSVCLWGSLPLFTCPCSFLHCGLRDSEDWVVATLGDACFS